MTGLTCANQLEIKRVAVFFTADDACFTTNHPPTVDAGADQSIAASSTTLVGTATDDGLPFGLLTPTWQYVSGPTAFIASPNALTTTVNFPDGTPLGTTVFRLRVSDGEFSSGDTVAVVRGTGGNRPPVTTADSGTARNNVLSTISVLANDSDPDGDPLTLTNATVVSFSPSVPGTSSSIGVDGSGNVLFTPFNVAAGTLVTIEYTVSDGRPLGTVTGTLLVTMLP